MTPQDVFISLGLNIGAAAIIKLGSILHEQYRRRDYAYGKAY